MAHKVLDFAHRVVARVLRAGDHAVDATAGNGHDTVRLARAVGSGGLVWAFDIQAEALKATRQRIGEEGVGDRVTLVRESHARLEDYVPKGVRVAVFNLGYLPGGNRSVLTRPASTVRALKAASRVLTPGGRIVLVAYTGHPGGQQEAEAARGWARGQAAAGWSVVRYSFSGRDGAPPEVLVVRSP